MSNTPATPKDDAPKSATPAPEAPAAKGAKSDTAPAQGLSGRTIGIGAAVGVGSAAIVAALLFTKPWKR